MAATIYDPSSIWEALRNWNQKRMAKNRTPTQGWGAQARAVNTPLNEVDLSSLPQRRDMAPPSQSDTISALRNEAVGPPQPSVAAPPAKASPQPVPVTPKPQAPVAATEEPYSSPYDELGPDGIAQLIRMGGLEGQMETARGRRDATSPQGRYVSGGRIYTPGSLLEHGASAYGKYRGAKDVKRIRGEQEQGRKSIIDLLRGKQAPRTSGYGIG